MVLCTVTWYRMFVGGGAQSTSERRFITELLLIMMDPMNSGQSPALTAHRPLVDDRSQHRGEPSPSDVTVILDHYSA
jgi:hypothetical protein